MTRKLKLCLIIPSLDRGGAEKQLAMLARGLDRSQFETTVIALSRSGPLEAELVSAGIPVVTIGKRYKLDPPSWFRLVTQLKALQPDIVHTWLFAANAYGRSAALRARVPCILGSERSVDPWKGAWQFAIDRWLARRCHGITTNSPGVVEFYAQHGIERSQFHVIPNGIPPRDPNQQIDRATAFARLGIDPSHKLILSIGRLWPQKGYKDLIWSAEILRVLRGDTSYVILGEGPERPRLEEYRDNVRAAAEVHMIGHREDAMQILPHADLLWNGSLYEGQSNTILEAMQAGVPVLASDIPGNRDLIENNVTGILFPVGDVDRLMRQSHYLLDHHEERQRLIDAARQRVEAEHRAESMVQRHQEYYRQKSQR